MSMSKEIAKEYASSLADLTANRKPLINMLTILAEENIEHAGAIAAIIEKHLAKVQPKFKLPVLYLVDSIVKNIGGTYTQYFSRTIMNMFTLTFQKVDEKVRSQMFKLRETWHDVFPATKLYQLDVKVNLLDPAWPIQELPPATSSIHPGNKLTSAAGSAAVDGALAMRPPTAQLDMKSVDRVPRRNLINIRDPRLAKLLDARSQILSAPVASPEATLPNETHSSEVNANKDVDLRVLHPVDSEANVVQAGQKRPSSESSESGSKKNKPDKFVEYCGTEDVDLHKLPQVDNNLVASPNAKSGAFTQKETGHKSPQASLRKDWVEVKEWEETKKTPIKLELVEEFDADDDKKTICVIMNQAKEQFSAGGLNKTEYESLMSHVLKLKERLEQSEAKQRESLHTLDLKLKAPIEEVENINRARVTPKRSNFGDIDERVIPPSFSETYTPMNDPHFMLDSDVRMNTMVGRHHEGLLPRPPSRPFYPAQPPGWRGPYRPRLDDFPQRPRRGVPPYFRGKFDRVPQFDPRVHFVERLPTPQIGTCQGACPLEPYVREATPPPLGAPSVHIPSTNIQALEYIDLDPVKTLQIDGIPREIRFYGETAIVMLDWDDPREIKFLPGARRVTFDNKDSIVLNFNEPYSQVKIDDQVFDIRFGAPTRDLYINGRWHESLFGGAPFGVIIDGKPRLIHLEGPLPQVDIGKVKRTDLVAGKINLIVDANCMCPVFLDAKVQKFAIKGKIFTIRFVDALRTVLINEQPFQVEFGGLPRPIFFGNEKHFIRFSVLPWHVRPGVNAPAGMEGAELPRPLRVPDLPLIAPAGPEPLEADQEAKRPIKTPSPESNQAGLDIRASLSSYGSAEPLFRCPAAIRDTLVANPAEEKPAPAPVVPDINDLFSKLLASGIIKAPMQTEEAKETSVVKQYPKSSVTSASAVGTSEAKIEDSDDAVDQSNNESSVEVVEPKKPIVVKEKEVVQDSVVAEPPTPLEAEDDDEVVLLAEPVDLVVVDDCDTDDETTAAREGRDRQAEIDFANIRIKQEPSDPDDEPELMGEEVLILVAPDQSKMPVMSSLDGNEQLEAPEQASARPGIRINISKALSPVAPTPASDPAPHLDSLEDVSAEKEPAPSGETGPDYKLKPTLEGVVFRRLPPKQKGSEISGMCSIM